MSKNLTLTLLAGVLATSIGHVHAADIPPTAIGWRGDGYSGICQTSAALPIDFNGVTGKNLRWKASLPNHSNSSPIAVGKKVFVMCDGGWPEGQDCPVLLCFDADTGKELWKKPVDAFDNLPETEAKEARADRAEYWRQSREVCNAFWELKHGKCDAARETALVEYLKQHWNEVREPALDWFKTKTGPAEYGYGEKKLMARLKKVNFGIPMWGWRCVGVTMPTPTSDGKYVYVATGHRTMTAFDFDGKKIWQEVITQNIPGEGAIFTEQFAQSPFLVDGVLLMHWLNHLWCYEPASGKLLWSTKTKPIPAHSMGQPTVLRLDASGKTVTCIFTTWGQLIRLSDGKLLADQLAWFGGNGIMSGNGKDVVWGRNGAEGGKPTAGRPYADLKGMFGLRFKLDSSGEKADTEMLPMTVTDQEMGWGVYPIFHQGRIICGNAEIRAFDSTKSSLVRDGARHFTTGSNGAILCGDRLIGQVEIEGGKEGNISTIRWIWAGQDRPLRISECPVEVLPLPENMPEAQQRKVRSLVGDTRTAHRGIFGWHNKYKTPFAIDDRLYVRTFDNLYCFAPAVNGTPSDDPVKVAQIRKESSVQALLPNLSNASAQERFETTKRLGVLKQPLPVPIAEALAKVLAEDPYEEIRLAAMQTLDACDPAGKAGWTILATKVFPATYGTSNVEYERRLEPQKALARMFDGLDPQGAVGLLKHWPEAETDPTQRLALLDLASWLNWKDPAMLQSALTAAQDPKRWGHHSSNHILPRYFTTVQGAADPATAEILLKAYAQDRDLAMEFTFRRNLSTEKYLAWLEPIAPIQRNVLLAWQRIGPAAIPSMKRVAEAMSGTDPKLDERGKAAQLEYRKAIEAAIVAMEKK